MNLLVIAIILLASKHVTNFLPTNIFSMLNSTLSVIRVSLIILCCLWGSTVLALQTSAQGSPPQGLSYSYYHGYWDMLPNFSTLTPVKTGTITNFSLAPRIQDDYFGFVHKGYIHIATAGTYTFYTSSDDGSALYIGGSLVVNNNGLHSLKEAYGTVSLSPGYHPIEVRYFERTGWQYLSVSYAGPGISKQLIPDAVIFQSNSAPNAAPTANAGPDITISMIQSSVTINGSGTDPDGSIVAYQWTQISGPSSRSLGGLKSPELYVGQPVVGVYEFELEVTDDKGATSKDRMILTVENPAPGLNYSYYHGNWTMLPDFSTLKPVKSGTVSNFTLEPRTQTTTYGFVYSGYIFIRYSGDYTFYTQSDDGSKLFIDGKLVVNNDGVHALKEVSGGRLYLTSGYHPIEVHYFERYGEGDKLVVSYEGPGNSKQPIPAEMLSTKIVGQAPPVITFTGDIGLPNYEAGKEYLINISVTDPNADDEITLAMTGTEFGKNEYSFTPELPLTGRGTISTQLRFTPKGDYIQGASFEFVARDAAGNESFEYIGFSVLTPPIIYKPDGPITIGINQPFRIYIPASGGDEYYTDISSLGFGENYFSQHQLFFEGRSEMDWPKEEHIGTHKVRLIARNHGIFTVDTLTVIVTADCTNKLSYLDYDGDGFGSSGQLICSSPGFVDNSNDCNDFYAAIHPGAEEISGDGIDNNCNGQVDEATSSTIQGLSYQYYHGSWYMLPDFSTLTPVKTGTVTNFTLAPRTQDFKYGFRYTGYIDIKTAGTYTFYTSSDDGSKLYIGGDLVVNNDGLHPTRERSGTVTLAAGKHPIEVTYFEYYGNDVLQVSYAGPGISKQAIPDAVLSTDSNNAGTKMAGMVARTTSTDETAQASLSSRTVWLRQNPVQEGRLKIETVTSDMLQEGQVNIYDASGRRFAAALIQSGNNSWEVDTRRLGAGVYLLLLQTKEGQQHRIRFTQK